MSLFENKKEQFRHNDRLYDYDNDGKITTYNGNAEHLVIPAKLPYHKPDDVEADCGFVLLRMFVSPHIIAESVFENNSKLISVEIPGSVGEIEAKAFYGCKNLDSVVIREGTFFIGDKAFCGCDSLKSVTIPKSVCYFGDEAFGCEHGDWSKKAESLIICGVFNK